MSADPYFVHSRLAADMDARLQILARAPTHIVLAGADGDHSRRLLAARYPQARFAEYDPDAARLQAAAQRRKTGLWAKLSGKNVPQFCQSHESRLPENGADMLWANLALTAAAQPQAVLANWAGALRTDGVLFFSHFGGDSLPEIRALLNEAGIACAAPLLADMHDWGDRLLQNGFADPVMDTAKLVLDYARAELLWQDLGETGLWTALQPQREAEARQIVQTAAASGSLRALTLEILFGHAVKKRTPLPDGGQEVRFYPRKSQSVSS